MPMEMEQLINTDNVLSQLDAHNKQLLLRLAASSPRFSAWFEHYLVKIRAKLKGYLRHPAEHAEDRKDVLTELICASLLLNMPCIKDLLYEPVPRSQTGPDFKLLLHDSQDVYVEARRIRRLLPAEVARDDFLDVYRTKLEAIPLKYTLFFSCHELKIGDLNEAAVYQKLISDSDQILSLVKGELSHMETEQIEHAIINLDHFAEKLKIDVTRRPDSTKNPHCTFSPMSHSPTNGFEHQKFKGVIFEKLPQLMDNACNILYVYIDNDSHEYEDMEDAIDYIKQERNDRSLLTSAQKLSGIFFHKRNDERRLWLNTSALYQVPPPFIEDFIRGAR